MLPTANAEGYCNRLRSLHGSLHGTCRVIAPGSSSSDSNTGNESGLLGTVSNLESTSSTREVASQSQSRFFALPSELRLMVYRYLSLSPVSADFPDSRGAYFACWRLHSEMHAELHPEKAFDEFKGMMSDCSVRCSPNDLDYIYPVTRGNHLPSFSLLQMVRIHITADYLAFHLMPELGECNVLSRLYSYYLKHLHIIVSRDHSILWDFFPWDDMKSMDHKLMAPSVAQGMVNCSRITFTLEDMMGGKADGKKTTTIENIFPGSDISYQLTIVEDNDGRQSERSYASSTRFKASTGTEV